MMILMGWWRCGKVVGGCGVTKETRMMRETMKESFECGDLLGSFWAVDSLLVPDQS